MNKDDVYWNELNKDHRLRNMEDNRPYWALSAEDYYGRTYESVAYDDTRADYNSKHFSGDLMYKSANTPFNMSYTDPSRERMNQQFNTTYTDPSRERMNQQFNTTYTDPSRERMNQRHQFDKLYPHNTYGGKEFKGIKKESDFKVPIITKNSKTKQWFDPFADYQRMPYDAEAVNIYTPLSQQVYKISVNEQNPHIDVSYNLPNMTDNYVPKKTSTPLLGTQLKVSGKYKFPDQSQDRRYPNTTNQSFSNIDRKISMVSDRMMGIEQNYSLPLWNVRDYFDGSIAKRP